MNCVWDFLRFNNVDTTKKDGFTFYATFANNIMDPKWDGMHLMNFQWLIKKFNWNSKGGRKASIFSPVSKLNLNKKTDERENQIKKVSNILSI